MNKLLLLLPFIGLVGCQQPEQPTDVAARASGRFAVQSYAFNGDTLYSSGGINKLGVSDLYIVVDRKGPDSVRVGGFAVKNGGTSRFLRDVGVQESNGTFRLTQSNSTTMTYDSRIEGDRFYERSTGGGWLELPSPSYTVKTPADPAQKGIIILAQKQQ